MTLIEAAEIENLLEIRTSPLEENLKNDFIHWNQRIVIQLGKFQRNT